MSSRPATAGPSPDVMGRPSVVRGTLPRRGPLAVYGIAAAIVVALGLATDVNLALLALAGAAVAGAVVYTWSRRVEGRRRAFDRLMTLGVTSAFLLAVTPLVSLVHTVVARGGARFDLEFFTDDARNVVGAGGGAMHAIIGTLVITGVATLFSVPIGVMAAVYMVEYGHGRLKKLLTFFVDVMTGIPSIVAGLFAYALFVIFFGPSVRLGVMGAVALSVLMIPIVVRSTEEVLKIVPNSLREASYALGVSKWRTIVKVVLPTALAGIVTGSMIAVSRIIGETAPLLITTGVFSSVNGNPFEGRMANLPVYIFNQYKYPGTPPDPYLDRAWAAALTLIVIVMVLFLAARLVYRRFGTEVR
ncbi:MAG: phosphate transport system permease protein [Miltoncostaeaceae bacterium]|jgi:phosphate transport system permease protein|nr:phosphate transport system permease protein [Miltoncostaeaceae bacterium]